MVEESPESFISRWRQYAAEVEMFAHTEGSPLLECRVGSAVLQLFERTGPYLSRPGPTRLIINPTTSVLEVLEGQSAIPHVESQGLGKLLAVGRLLAQDSGVVVIDAGVPLVVSLACTEAPVVAEGSLVRLASDGPVHAFVVSHAVGAAAARQRAEAVDESI